MTQEKSDARRPGENLGEGPPPWINPEIQQRIQWRDGDIVISVPVESGTTWTMNIVHQLREGGDPGKRLLQRGSVPNPGRSRSRNVIGPATYAALPPEEVRTTRGSPRAVYTVRPMASSTAPVLTYLALEDVKE